MYKIAIYMAMALLTLCTTAHAEGLDTLRDVARGQAQIQKDYDRETRNFEDVKHAIERGKLKTGESKESIKKSYGEPVISFDKKKNSPETWIYKAARSDWSGGEKIYLMFDDSGNLSKLSLRANEVSEAI